MTRPNVIPIALLCRHYQVETTFFHGLREYGLIEVQLVEQSECITTEQLPELEKMIRIYQDLNLNLEGIDVVWNLLQRMEELQNELRMVRSRLHLYE